MDAMFHSFYLGIPCLLDRSTSKEVQQHTQTLDLTWSVYGTACTAFSVYCTFPSQHVCAFSTCYSTLTVLRSTSFSIMTLTMSGVELGLIENFITSSMTAGYFYMALPLNVLERSLERMIKTIDSPTGDTQFDPASCLTLLTGGVAGLKDWIPITSCKNLHFTARGALLMALENFKNLPANVKDHFENSAVVLLRFKLNANKTLDMFFQQYLWLWNRHYWEHSLAFQYDNFTLNLSEFLTMKTFVFGLDDTGNHYSFNNFASEVDTFMEMTDD